RTRIFDFKLSITTTHFIYRNISSRDQWFVRYNTAKVIRRKLRDIFGAPQGVCTILVLIVFRR
ncbi:MAG: hypothetical protein DMG59_06140, partial [Acidobacteria bacterium]